jgi:large subunit ribosomal protein L29
MKASELKGMSDEQLGMTLAEIEKHLFQLRFQSATDRLETPSEIRRAKRDIARIQTEQRRRQLEKLKGATIDQLKKLVDDLNEKTEGPGKRRVNRSLMRVESLHTLALSKAPKPVSAPAPAAPKGK